MTKLVLASLFISTLVLADDPAPAPSPAPAPVASCPDLSGHYQHKQFGASADAYVTQTGCATMEIKVTADILGEKYDEDVTSPLDGVTRQYTSPNPDGNEVDYASAEFKGDTVNFMVERDVTSNGQVTKSYNAVQGSLTSPNVLHIIESDVDANGNNPSGTHEFDFNRVQ